MKKSIFGLICLGIIAFMIGDSISSDFFENVGLGTFLFLGGGYAIYKSAHQKNHYLYWGFLLAIVVSFILSETKYLSFFDNVYVALILIWIAYTIYFRIQHKNEIKAQEDKINETIHLLKEDLKQVNQEIQLNNQYLKNNDMPSYISLSRKIYPELKALDEKLGKMKDDISNDYERLHKRILDEARTIKTNFKGLGVNLVPSELEKYEDSVRETAPEIIETYRNIQIDHEAIVKKLKENTIDNTQELLALHESYMKRFDDIFQTYMDIKKTPKNYYNAEERLEQAKLAMEKIDLALDEQLRQLNEHDLSDFEVSLRLMLEE